MDKSKGWWGGCVFGVGLSLLVLLLFLMIMDGIHDSNISETALHNLSEGAWTASLMAKVFTVSNCAVAIMPFLIWAVYHQWFSSWFMFLRTLPPMIGMLGTLWSLVESDMTNPGSLAKQFSVAIVSTILGLILKIAMELICSFPCFKNELIRQSDDGEKV